MPHEIHFPILSQLGLNESETLVYELLLELGPKSAQELLTPSGLGRGNLYNVLTSLKKKGLVFEEPGAKTVFKAVDPEVLRGLAKAKMAATQDLLNQVNAAMPTLKSHYNLITKRPTVRIFEGIEGIKEVYKETLADKQDIFALVGTDDPAPELYKWLTKTYSVARVKNNIPAFVVASGNQNVREYFETSEQFKRKTFLINKEIYPFHGEVDVFGDKIAFISYKKEELISVIIESPSLAETIRSTVKFILDIGEKIKLPPEPQQLVG
jgi:sugar-specific transcriptional regulator TrmB